MITQRKKIIIFLALISLIMLLLLPLITQVTYALERSNVEYTDVLSDLEKDDSFNIMDYAGKADDYGVYVKNIAEGNNKELFLYVYQPSHDTLDLTATSVSISSEYSSNGQNLTPLLYDLELVSTYSVFDKYLVKGYVVSDEPERYYNIITIYRRYNETIDKNISGGTTSEIAYHVGQQWCCYYFNDELVYEMGTFDTLEVEVVTNGYLEFASGLHWGNLVGSFKYCDSHFIAFNVEDYIIEHIYDADLAYRIRDKSYSQGIGLSGEPTYGEFSQKYVTLHDTDEVTYNGGGLFAKTYTWNRIMRSADFVKNFETQGGILNETSKDTLLRSQWVFPFVETNISVQSGFGSTTTFRKDVADVTILRLHFLDVTGKFYNLGVVMDKTTADDIADGNAGGLDLSVIEDAFKKLLMLIAIIVVIVILVVCFPVVVSVFSAIFNVLKIIFKAIWFVITLPFRLIASLFKKRE